MSSKRYCISEFEIFVVRKINRLKVQRKPDTVSNHLVKGPQRETTKINPNIWLKVHKERQQK